MKRFLSVCLLMLCLSFPVFGGHTVGGNRWCECNTPESCTGVLGLRMGEETQQDSAPELGLLLLVLTVMMLRYRA
jgi:hypothetical protein